MGIATTLLAAIAAVIFFGENIAWAVAASVIIGLIQFSTLRAMKAQLISNARLGMDDYSAVHSVSDGLAQINAIASFCIWGLFVYSVFILLG